LAGDLGELVLLPLDLSLESFDFFLPTFGFASPGISTLADIRATHFPSLEFRFRFHAFLFPVVTAFLKERRQHSHGTLEVV
jgi:hypothetical protein